MQLSSLPFAIVLLATNAVAQGVHKKPPPNNITPHIVPGFLWRDPFPTLNDAMHIEPSCTVQKHFWAQEYTLHDLEEPEPLGLKQWAPGLKNLFKQREYPGGWSGYDRHGYDRSLLKMGMDEVPTAVKDWIEKQEREGGEWKGLFGVFKKPADKKELIEDVVDLEDIANREKDGEQVVIFAPAAIYHTLPLWAAEESECKGESLSDPLWLCRDILLTIGSADQLLDLSLYKPDVEAGNVIGWPDHKRPDLYNKAEFRVTANLLKEKAAESETKEEL